MENKYGVDDAMTTALDEIFASNRTDKLYYVTIEISHSSFSPVNPLRYVQGYNDLTAYIEAGAPYDAGNEVTFLSGAFELRAPEKGVKGKQTLTCTLYGPSFDIVEQLELQSVSNREAIKLIYRIYESGDLTSPASDAIELTISNPVVSGNSVSFSASFADVVNKQFPSVFYKLSTHPGLA